ncbi:B3 domain-containing protein Os03g0620400-like isoform X2 [Carex rostrata]
MFLGSMIGNVELEGPSGYTWPVKIVWSDSDNTFALKSGWKEFVTANKIYENDILVFTYKDNSSFKVLIFDRSGCEKVAPFFAKNMNTKPESEKLNDSPSRASGAPYREVKIEIISLTSGSSDTDESSREISTRDPRACMTGERICGKRKQKDFVQESTESESNAGKDYRAMKASRLYVVPLRTHLTQAQEEIANRMARKTQKDSQLLVKILSASDTPSSRDCTLIREARHVLQTSTRIEVANA